ncbi:Coenzyme F420 hydrogenase/dehydrogenase, beta subunit C-terminal domain [Pseudomonas rubra]|uniref:Coenzyme F420 hydrogenase/dehydrogenase, beta subunit C-terminal domain n=1 Tax=Pseudomonas rubra TaxID=2942627 RepID=A0ABT5P348_9PSED|nr:Coenzyme F420 hydrogenase/dehydrogenase, beta subunit C-terminal domain [Pseudomonas rubra]MDD1012699.1 Coenzyme F420 hydrogenase/dehydrogenase, beta subunit C-terminal domain [Pseudomonas rubra]MDD1041593.1 Coenzyme F420 hydrogenase/dehydrogenase, beta subunit C-terminal domain [Pseudomonas rubra]MDD1155529.1 Coenzyme F420 hydrogenase/dehydrogenase, beta subunit C-terminal domain [Pseudomonas rubra]
MLLKLTVLDQNLCAGCGACALVCPEQLISFDPDTVTPVLDLAGDHCEPCGECLAVCPGLQPDTDRAEQELFGRTRTAQERWLGINRAAIGARSTDAHIVRRSASGGTATTLLLTARAHLGVDLTLTMGRDAQQGWRSAAQVGGAEQAIINNAQSTYQLAPYLNALRECFEQTPEARIALVGLACHVQAIRKLQRRDTTIGRWAKSQVVCVIETACSSNTLPAGTRSIISDVLAQDPQQVTDIKYREGEYPGRLQVTLIDNQTLGIDFWEILGKLKDNKTFRCLSCGDWMSGLADVSVCDGDPNIFEASLNGSQEKKHGRALVRTDMGQLLVDSAIAHGRLETWAIDLSGFNLGLERKKNRRRFYETQDLVLPAGPGIGDLFDEMALVDDAELINPANYRSAQ